MDDQRNAEDRLLVASVLAGDREAFRDIVERAQGPVYRACLRVLGPGPDAEDTAQESFVIAFRSLAGYRGDGPIEAWLVRIATRHAFRRRSQSRPTADLSTVVDRTAGPTQDPLQATLAREQRDTVRSAVASLNEPYREVVALRYFGEMSLDEVATATNRPLNTVKTQVRRGLQRLGAELRRSGVDR